MKKQISLILVFALMLSLTACNRVSASDLMAGISPGAEKELADPETGAVAAADFGIRLFRAALREDENTLLSPLSVLYALGMTVNGAQGETLVQMEKVLGMESDTLNSFLLAYWDSLPESGDYKLRLANSLWFKDTPSLEVRKSFLQVNADYYGAGAYRAAFDEATRNRINSWVREHTDGMIPKILDQIPEDAVLYLVNALAFDARWENVYYENQIRDGVFTSEEGTPRNVKMMHSKERAYLEDEMATGVIKYYKDRSYAFVALLPKEGVSVSRYVESLDGNQLLELLAEARNVPVVTGIPKFETEYSADLGQVLQEMGITEAFDRETADFSRMGTYGAENRNLCISQVLHKTFLSVSEKGTKAGAATVVQMAPGAAAPGAREEKEVILDRPFVYMLIDCETNLPFFIGTMMDPGV